MILRPNSCGDATATVSVSEDPVPSRPTAAYLRPLIRTLLDDAAAPSDLRERCLELMRAINANDLAEIPRRVDVLLDAARLHGLRIP